MQAMKADDLTNRFALDVKALSDLRVTARNNPREGLKAAAQQFEAYFLQMVMKSMREATPQDELFGSDATRFYTGMLDQQLAQDLSGKGSLGFARMLEQQLGRGLPGHDGSPALPAASGERTKPSLPPALRRYLDAAAEAGVTVSRVPDRLAERVPEPLPVSPTGSPTTLPAANPAAGASAFASAATAAGATAPGRTVSEVAGGSRQELLPAVGDAGPSDSPREFVERVWPHAVEAARQIGVPPHFLVAHAALETGWGQHEPRRHDGSPSYNLFGVKAGRSWRGEAVEATTTEFVGGVAGESRERFRAYGSYAESFRDYAALLTSRPRFSGVLGTSDGTDFARKLQQAGYATDPMYADKLARIINGGTLRQALMG